MKKYIMFFVLIVLLSTSFSAHALMADGFEGFDYYTWYGTTADDVKIAWDPGEGFNTATDTYELILYNPERDITRDIATGIVDNFYTLKCPKAGHWVPRVRVKRVKTDDTIEYSDWSVATDSAVARVNGEPRAWWLFVWIASTGPISSFGDTRSTLLKDQGGP